MKERELAQRLLAVEELCTTALNSGRPMLTYDFDLLNQIKAIAVDKDNISSIAGKDIKPLQHVIISCGVSKRDTRIAIGIVIEYKDENSIEFFRGVPNSNTLDKGGYDAIYFGLTQLMSLKNNPACPIEVRCSNQMVVEQLNNRMKIESEVLKRKRDSILELHNSLPVTVSVIWRPENSTISLAAAEAASRQAFR